MNSVCKNERNTMKKLIPLLFLMLTACANNSLEFSKNSEKIQRNKNILITLPSDGIFDGQIYQESGKKVQLQLAAAFAPYSENVYTTDGSFTLDDAIRQGKNKKADYVISPQITHWEDRHTHWSGIRDRVEMVIDVIDVPSSKKINEANLFATNSSFGAMFEYKNPPPERLLNKMFSQYTEEIVE